MKFHSSNDGLPIWVGGLNILGLCLVVSGCQGVDSRSIDKRESGTNRVAMSEVDTVIRVSMSEGDTNTAQVPKPEWSLVPRIFSFSTDTTYSGDSLAIIIPPSKDEFRFELFSRSDGDAARNSIISVHACNIFAVSADSFLVVTEVSLDHGDLNDVTYPHQYGINYVIRMNSPLPRGRYAFTIKWVMQNTHLNEGILTPSGDLPHDQVPRNPLIIRKIWQGQTHLP